MSDALMTGPEMLGILYYLTWLMVQEDSIKKETQ
jgi:hypothetical protein